MMGSVTLFVPIITNYILQGGGDTFLPMFTLIIGAVINIGLDPLLIYGIGPFPEMGVAGAAIATVTARGISGLYIVLILLRGKHQVKLRLRELRLSKTIVKELYRVGVPGMVMQLLASVMIAGVNRIVVAYNVLAIAVVGIFFRLQSFIFMPIFGSNHGYIPIVGYNYGHKNPQRMKEAMKVGFLIGFGFSFLGFMLFFFFPRTLVRMFNSDPELIRLGADALRRIGISFPLIGPTIVGITTFQATGRGLPSLVVSILRQLVLLLPIMFILGNLYGLPTLWLAFPISTGVAVILLIVWLRTLLKKVFREMEVQGAE
jgi:putative MATE family efflux protein